MAGSKLHRAKRAVRQALERLAPTDHFALVSYNHTCRVDMALTTATPEHIALGIEAIEAMAAGGQTDLHTGWLRGCEQAAAGLDGCDLARVFLLTDGRANFGECQPTVLVERAVGLRQRSVTTTTFGLGEDFDEELLEAMAREGGGAFYYIASSEQIPQFITRELEERLATTARDCRLLLTATDPVTIAAVAGFAAERKHNETHILLGDLCADQLVDVVLKVNAPAGAPKSTLEVTIDCRAEGVVSSDQQVVRWTYAGEQDNDGQRRHPGVAAQVATLYAAKARQRALSLNRAGRFDAAREALRQAVAGIYARAGDGAEVRAVVAELEREAQRFGRGMSEPARKRVYFDAATQISSRNPDGSSRIIGAQRTSAT
jgi:hypothetical protein